MLPALLNGCTQTDALSAGNTVDQTAAGAGLILILGAAVVVATGALVIEAIEHAQGDPQAAPGAKPDGPVPNGTWTASSDSWTIRLAIAGQRFEGSAYCKLTGTPISFSGSFDSEGAATGIGRERVSRFAQYEDNVPFAVVGEWPALELQTKRACGDSVVQLQLT